MKTSIAKPFILPRKILDNSVKEHNVHKKGKVNISLSCETVRNPEITMKMMIDS